MEMQATIRTLGGILSENKKYVIPRFQREYSWTKDEVAALWSDLCRQIQFRKGKAKLNEYFVGCIVLSGQDRSHLLKIVDGQQRLTTFTILLRALVQALINAGDSASANSIYKNYIEGVDDGGRPFFKLEGETQKAFFQHAIQQLNQKKKTPANEEEALLQSAYSDLLSRMEAGNLLPSLNGATHKQKLTALRQQVVDNMKFIYVLVPNEQHAYTIFETLNARGMNLSALDLVKNWIFKNLPKQYPIDDAMEAWKGMSSALSAAPQPVDKDVFFRHFWLSRYSYVSEGRMYGAFTDLMQTGTVGAEAFQDLLSSDASTYSQLSFPSRLKFTSHSENQLFESLSALSMFRVSQVRPLLLALHAAREDKRLQMKRYTRTLKLLEHFHFVFTVVSAGRSSGLDGKYSKAARDVRAATSASLQSVLTDLEQELIAKWPAADVFREGINRLWFTNQVTKDKKIIQYFFGRYERRLRKTKELSLSEISIEHIVAQSSKPLEKVIGKLGNLLPLDHELNGLAGTKAFADKLVIYRDSELNTVSEFAKKYRRAQSWDANTIDQRTAELADVAYREIWIP
jgi:hypothetical protein